MPVCSPKIYNSTIFAKIAFKTYISVCKTDLLTLVETAIYDPYRIV